MTLMRSYLVNDGSFILYGSIVLGVGHMHFVQLCSPEFRPDLFASAFKTGFLPGEVFSGAHRQWASASIFLSLPQLPTLRGYGYLFATVPDFYVGASEFRIRACEAGTVLTISPGKKVCSHSLLKFWLVHRLCRALTVLSSGLSPNNHLWDKCSMFLWHTTIFTQSLTPSLQTIVSPSRTKR